jgi:hypothetical protein
MSDKIREEFEKWAESEGYNFNEPHWAVKKELMLECWQASSKAKKVELPPTIKSESGYYAYDALDVHSMLDAAGIIYE